MVHNLINLIVDTVGNLGYLGIFMMMFLESSFFPFPSEVVMIPVGVLIYKGEMNVYLAIVCGVGGSLCGALLNYYLALKMGRAFILRYGKYVFFTPESMRKIEVFFKKHGHISTFVGRLLPGVRQYISLPAGIAKMNLGKFCIFTTFGAGIWVCILTWIGYSLAYLVQDPQTIDLLQGENAQFFKDSLWQWTFYILGALIILIALYIYKNRK
ncbi:DedA family protein [Helicobacter cholecystus]|uniref:DedA family protein n=1 Tax=Helicobacter cholecystus TaxID=45498 RepID=UPI003F754F5E